MVDSKCGKSAPIKVRMQDMTAIRGQDHIDPADEKRNRTSDCVSLSFTTHWFEYFVYDQPKYFLQVKGDIATYP